ncbi:3'(2'),5'-bisphosphate nucleotidase CysQ [Devosia rhodophyticola]|uniref:3'(2'),5'-bisphosphate nucleotidase CysQ n=1 Tax=Devosia rhodophyticola TaxID=3026423 RepID=A0ABY7YYT8_9HYPH|nr:3'(2'),5'-bisphosphate nucleotidase CysQ [Devosia rhodophyticola]WDR06327.1 3'(2'),5'-bisphosphate nucleotidase CysQ [Devosia rhodophyticola]
MSQSMVELMVDASMAAARLINMVYARPIAATQKSDGSPVTEADAAAETVILEMLAATRLPVLAEESASAGRIPALGERYFVVDPLDGTKEFIKRNGEFTVNIALIEHGRPTIGVVLAPVTGATYVGSSAGAFICDTSGGIIENKRPIRVSPAGPIRIVASRSHGHEALAHLCESLKVVEDVSIGSSLKFCLLAQGAAELYPRFTPTCEWDTAAGQAVLEAAGGAVLTLDGHPLHYGKRSSDFLNPFFVAAASTDLAKQAAREMVHLVA